MSYTKSPEPIAVIGSGCRFPGGADTPSRLWDVIHHPEDLSTKPPASRFDVDLFYHPVGTHHGTTNATHSYFLDDTSKNNVAQFDAGFFHIQPGEVDAMDPQQRLLMEVVYDGLCASGQPMEKLRGSNTAVYVGMMCDDFNTMLNRDWATFPRYTATGIERGIIANRVSYFFDWHGPSMTIDTACSSSMVALDQAVQILRGGHSKMAVAAGTSLILSPAMYISESNLGMLSSSGRCAMWDVSADGYARGEGVAAVLLKTLSQALADGDPIDCIIRETAVNQDGHTSGLTVPSHKAQADLIRECYARAGLDPVNNIADRPQFFQAHGTGTQAGDPQEAEAISSALFPVGSAAASEADKLLVGSIKTVIGHTEGTAGVASIIGTAMALKHGIVPPNLHFEDLNPKVTPFFEHLEVPTVPTAWPTGQCSVHRASVNSFGFGGTNAHAILEAYSPDVNVLDVTSARTFSRTSPLFTPLLFSAASETALRTMLATHLDYLKAHPDVHLANLAYTLQHRRSTLAYRRAIAAPTVNDAIQTLESLIDPVSGAELGTRFSTSFEPAKILGVFTGQGAQWPRMGAQLIEVSPFAEGCVDELDAALQSLPNGSDRPVWTIKDQLLASKDTSRVAEAALSQPLCTAVQIVLVRILRAARITFSAVVGHSSGEIGAAYAAGLISAVDAIRIAYFRGVHAKLASSPNKHAPGGAMMAVGTSVENARSLCDDRFAGRIHIAAVNSDSSVTLSGDEDAIDEAAKDFKVNGIFARKLQVDTAYHSTHMAPCAGPYLASLERCGIQAITPLGDTATTWFSSVYEGNPMRKEELTNRYWVDNMCKPVLFSRAIIRALERIGTFDLAIEVGPHAALKAPATSTMKSFGDGSVAYTGLLARGQSDVEQLSMALGFIWQRLGWDSVQFSSVETLLSGTESKMVINDLPSYPFDHGSTYSIGGNPANHLKHRRAIYAPNPVLGALCIEAFTPGEFQWRNILRPTEIPWLRGHMLQGQIVFPAAGYVSMAVEAMKAVLLDNDPNTVISVLKITNVYISRALVFDDEAASLETVFRLSSIETTEFTVTAEWGCYSVADGTGNVLLNAKGSVSVQLAPCEPHTLPLIKTNAFNLVSLDEGQFYSNLSEIGYGYSSPFHGLCNMHRKLGYSFGTLSDQSGCEWEDHLVLHPGMLDSGLQSIFAAWSFPGARTQTWSLHVPVSIAVITINPYFTPLGDGGKQSTLLFESFVRSKEQAKLVGDVYLHTDDGQRAFVRFEGVTMVPLTAATPGTDIPIFSQLQYKVAKPDGLIAAAGEKMTDYEVQTYQDVDRVAYWFARNASLTFPATERHSLLPHFQHYLRWCDLMVSKVGLGKNHKVAAGCDSDTREDIAEILAKYEGRKDVRFVEVVGENLAHMIRTGAAMSDNMNQDGLLRAFYDVNALCAGPTRRWLARLIAQISHRFPGLNILEIGAGTGAATSSVLDALVGAYASYTFTDISRDSIEAAQKRFAREDSRMVYKTFNMEQHPSEQGFAEGFYDVIIATNVLHLSADIEATMRNVRHLLKPGGYVVVGEVTSNELLCTGMTLGTMPSWWIGAETGRPWGPLLSLAQWGDVLRNTGFAGIDSITPNIDSSLPVSVFVGQAVDNQVKLLREPLAVENFPDGIKTDNLAIIGGVNMPVYELSRKVSEVLSHRFKNKEFFTTVEDYASSHMAKATSGTGIVTVLSLTDLDRPYLEDLTASKFKALQVLFATASSLIWVTCGSREDTPYSYMMLSLANTVNAEQPALDVQMWDLDYHVGGIPPTTALDLAEALLRQVAMHIWGTNTDVLLWTMEPQVFVEDGKHLITRLLPDSEKNRRYNSQRRNIVTIGALANKPLQLLGTGKGKERSLELQWLSPLRLFHLPASRYRTVRLTHSVLYSVAVMAAGFFRLCTAVDVVTGEQVLALSGSNQSPANIPEQWCIGLEETLDASSLVAVAANILADYILGLIPDGATLLVNEPGLALQSVLSKRASAKHVNAVFVTSELMETNNACSTSVLLRPNCHQHVIESSIPPSTALYVNFSRGSRSNDVGDAIANYLPTACLKVNEYALVSHEVNTLYEPDLTELLRNALNNAQGINIPTIESIALQDTHDHNISDWDRLTVVDWTTSDSTTAKIQPIDCGELFHDDKTYFLVGMANELGQSLARWMIVHGARYVVLASRTPKVNPLFIEDMKKRYGAIIWSVSMDVTSRDSLLSVHKAICAALPPIAGIINGAMVLNDALFANMSFEDFQRVTRPKVIGTTLLDELFYDDTSLEFFIVTSSITAVLGWSGQGNYSAANEFMTSLVSQRRNRGVAGSAINIPAVIGIGYAAHSEAFDFDYFASLGYINISEEDLHCLVAEAVLSGRPGQGPDSRAQVVMGVDYVPEGLQFNAAHKRDVRLSHFTARGEAGGVDSATTAGVSVRMRLQGAESADEAYAVMRDALIERLKRILRIPREEMVQDGALLVELGVDSIVAVDIHAWFLQEMEVVVPALKILGGGSIKDLVQAALDRVPADIMHDELLVRDK